VEKDPSQVAKFQHQSGLEAARQAAAQLMGVPATAIKALAPMPGGMTNTSFTFQLTGTPYVLRLPGAGTENLINRKQEREVYQALAGQNLTDEVIAVDRSGRRVTRFYSDARVADPHLDSDLATSMRLVRQLHQQNLPLRHRFAIEKQVANYRQLCQNLPPAPYPKPEQQAAWANRLLAFREELNAPEVYCHCDLACDNVLILPSGQARLIDWEYSGRADPIMDVAMYGMYSFLDRQRLEYSLALYLEREPNTHETARLYLYLALAGYLWSIWAHYKQSEGAEYGDYGPKTNAYLLEYYPLLTSGDLMVRAVEEMPYTTGAPLPVIPRGIKPLSSVKSDAAKSVTGAHQESTRAVAAETNLSGTITRSRS
jgi:thiamine kinase-like enzyme